MSFFWKKYFGLRKVKVCDKSLRDIMLTILYVTLDFFLNDVNVNDCLCKLLQDNFTQTKKRLPWAVKFYSLHNSNINISHQQSHFQIFKNTNIAKLQRTIEYISDHLQRTLFQLCIVILSSSLLIKKKNRSFSIKRKLLWKKN